MNFTTRAASVFVLSVALISLSPAARAADTLRDFCRMLENPKIPTGLRRMPYVPVTFGAAFGDPALGFCEVHPDTAIPLASTTKVLTATAALVHLNTERPFDPRVRWQEVSPGNPTAIANLEVIGDGGVEPWTTARFKKLVDHLVQMGVREIRGAKARASDPRWRSVRIPNWPAEDYSPTEENDCSVPLPRPFHFAGAACVEVIVTGPTSAEWADFSVPLEQRVPIRREAPEAPFALRFEPGPPGREASGALVIRGQPKLARRAVTRFRVAYRDSEAVATALLRKALDGRIPVVDP
ncbi:MAG TPA: D-alanyl-D-alanine carboxypeptidase, partial [Bdellovibrionota bacterium]|nr:D-alanyl-D-alanine carboxypeptidase [Bdellovibrionota bacterium]